jgi:rhodanese-related sulfurtransferase
MIKKYIKEVLIILIVAIGIGIAYNFYLPKPLSLIYKKKEISKLSDDALFGNGGNGGLKNGSDIVDEKTVTYEQMLKIINDDNFVIIDARSQDYYSISRIGKAINIFPYDDEAEVMNKIMDLAIDKTYIVYCDGGNCDSSHKIAEILLNFGYQTFIYSGGWDEWSKRKGIE